MTKGSRMFQIWFDPDLNKTLSQPASYNDYKANDFPESNEGTVNVRRMVGDNAPIQMDSPSLNIENWGINSDFVYELPENTIASIYVLNGTPTINDEATVKDDFVQILGEKQITIKGNSSLFVVFSPESLNYKTYAQIMQERMHH